MPIRPLVVTEFWAGLLTFVLFFALVTVWAFVLTDLFMRKGMSGWKKAAWIVAIIFFPFIGALLYLGTRRPSMAEIAYVNQAVGEQATFIEGAAVELERLNKLRETGEISGQEYETLRAQIVAGKRVDKAA
jgi:hypothetical protein